MERQRIASGSPFEKTIGFSRAMRVGNRVIVAGTAPIWPDGSCDPDPEVQAARCLEIITTALAEAGAGPEHVVRTRTYLTDAADGEAVGRAHGALFAEIDHLHRIVDLLPALDAQLVRMCLPQVEIEPRPALAVRNVPDAV